jgi:hypothetical protein
MSSPNGAEAKAAAGKEAGLTLRRGSCDFLGSGSIARRKLCSQGLEVASQRQVNRRGVNVRFWPKADIPLCGARVRF